MSRYLTLRLIGVDGSMWDLAGPGEGAQGVLLRRGPQKLIDAPAKTFWIESATGSHYQGRRFERRDPVFSVQIHHPDPDVWADIDSQFRMALGMYDDEFVLEATTSYGVRRLKMRLLTEPTAYGTAEYEGGDPFNTRDSTLAISAACSMPFWAADDLTFSWSLPSGTSGSTTFPFENRGDVIVWPRYFVNAPGTWVLPDPSWGQKLYATTTPPYHRGTLDANRTVPLPALLAGEDCSVNTDPDEETLVASNGALVQARWNANGLLYPIAPKTLPTNVTVSVTGASAGAAVQVWIPRRFSRPFGVTV